VRERARSVDFVDFVDFVDLVYFVYKSYNFYIFYIFYKITMFTLFTKNIKLTLLTLLTKNIKSTLSTLSTFLRLAIAWNVKNYYAQKGESVQRQPFWEKKWFFLAKDYSSVGYAVCNHTERGEKRGKDKSNAFSAKCNAFSGRSNAFTP